jgi:hypothetical protein
MRVDEVAIGRLGHGVDGQVSPREILLEGDIGCELSDESAISGAGLTLETRERMLLASVWMQEDREVTTDGCEALRLEFFGCRADYHPVAFGDGAAEQ